MSYEPPPRPTSGAPYPAAAYQSYGYPTFGSAPQRTLQPLRALATAASILLGAAAVFSVLAAAFFFSRASAAHDFIAGNSTIGDLNDADNRVQAGISLFFVALVAAAVVFIIWQFRHAKNAEAIRGSLTLGPGWAIAGWFIPLANYVLPALQLGQAAKASDPDLPSGASRERGRVPAVIVIWAVTFGIAALLFLAGSSTRPNEDEVGVGSDARSTLEDFARSDRLAGAGMLVYGIGALTAILMVRTLTARQDRAGSSLPHPGEQPPDQAGNPQQYFQPYQPEYQQSEDQQPQAQPGQQAPSYGQEPPYPQWPPPAPPDRPGSAF